MCASHRPHRFGSRPALFSTLPVVTGLDAALREIARSRSLLVASDYDGVLAPIVSDPDSALPDRGAITSLTHLATAPDTHVALISGRTLADLRRLSGEPEGVVLLGSHGAEATADRVLSGSREALRDGIADEMARIATRFPGSRVEIKPAGVVFHYRDVAGHQQDDAARSVLTGPAARPRIRVMEGKKIVELSLTDVDKGIALRRLRRALEVDAVVFLGDDVTDEDAFAILGPDDVGIKVGPGPTQASHRIPTQGDVAAVLATLATLRSA